jgi:hypothetical protein
MTFGKATRLEVLIPKLVTQIASVTGISPHYVFPTLAENQFQVGGPSDRYVLVTNFAGVPGEPLVTGGGELATSFATRCELVMYARLDVDQAGRDTRRLVDASLGLLAEWRLLLRAAQMWAPDDGGSPAQGLLMQPARVGNWLIRGKLVPDSNGWVQLRTTLDFVFLQDLS